MGVALAVIAFTQLATLAGVVALAAPRLREVRVARKQAGEGGAATEAEAVEVSPAAPRHAVVLPVDLEALADSESEPWARDDARAALRDRFLERRSWEQVRADLLAPRSDG